MSRLEKTSETVWNEKQIKWLHLESAKVRMHWFFKVYECLSQGRGVRLIDQMLAQKPMRGNLRDAEFGSYSKELSFPIFKTMLAFTENNICSL